VNEATAFAQRSHDLAVGAEERARAAEAPIERYEAEQRARDAWEARVEAAIKREAELMADVTPRLTHAQAEARVREEYRRGERRLRYL
jgi:hypothetical protein